METNKIKCWSVKTTINEKGEIVPETEEAEQKKEESFEADPFLVKRRTFKSEYNLNNKETVKEQRSYTEKINFITNILYYIFIFPFNIIFITFFKIPNQPSELLGIFRVISMIIIIFNICPGNMSHFYDIQQFLLPYISEDSTEIIINIMCVICSLNFIFQLGVVGGWSRGWVFDETSSSNSTEYKNIKGALKYRDGVLRQMPKDKAAELLIETGFIDCEGTINNLDSYPATKKTLRYLDGVMKQLTRDDQLNMLKQFSGRK